MKNGQFTRRLSLAREVVVGEVAGGFCEISTRSPSSLSTVHDTEKVLAWAARGWFSGVEAGRYEVFSPLAKTDGDKNRLKKGWGHAFSFRAPGLMTRLGVQRGARNSRANPGIFSVVSEQNGSNQPVFVVLQCLLMLCVEKNQASRVKMSEKNSGMFLRNDDLQR